MFANVLTHAPRLRHSGLPLIYEALQAPFRLPKSRKKSCRNYFCCQSTCRASVWRAAFAYWQGATSSIREDWRLRRAGERCALPFLFPKSTRLPMIPTITATPRPAVTALPCNLIPAGEVRHG